MYLYVDKRKGLTPFLRRCLQRLESPVAVFTMILTADKKLARVNVDDVRAAIDEQGFYLQMPPAKEDYLLDVHRAQLNARDAAQ